MMTEGYCMILTTVGSRDEAERISELLVLRRYAACVQISSINSTYRWEGEIHKDAEYLLLIKTKIDLYNQVESAILENHSYEVPEIIQIPVMQGFNGYLGWIDANTSETSS